MNNTTKLALMGAMLLMAIAVSTPSASATTLIKTTSPLGSGECSASESWNSQDVSYHVGLGGASVNDGLVIAVDLGCVIDPF